MRIVNTAAFAMFYFWIDGHDMRIIEVDGVCLLSCVLLDELMFGYRLTWKSI